MKGRRKKVKIYHINLMMPFVEREAAACMSVNVPEEIPSQIPSLIEFPDFHIAADGISKAVKVEKLELDQRRNG